MHDSLLGNLSIGELAEVVGGSLRLGLMPPLGGDLEPVGPVVVESRHVRAGDVFWALDQAGEHGARFAEVAFSRDAAGAVVCRREVEPWAGKFSIEVADSRLALWQLAAYLRRQFHGTMIGVAGHADSPEANERTCGWLRAVSGAPEHPADGVVAGDPTIRLPLQLLRLGENDAACVLPVALSDIDELENFSHLCDPEIVVITTPLNSNSRPFGPIEQQTSTCEILLANLPPRTALVGSTECLPATTADHLPNRRCIRVGTGPDGDIAATVAPSERGLRFEIEGQVVDLPRATRGDLPGVLSAFAVGRLLGKTDQEIARDLRRADEKLGLARTPAASPVLSPQQATEGTLRTHV